MGATAKPRGGEPHAADTATPPRINAYVAALARIPRAYAVALALVVAATALTAVGLAMEDTGVEFGALALIVAAWLVRDSARTEQATS